MNYVWPGWLCFVQECVYFLLLFYLHTFRFVLVTPITFTSQIKQKCFKQYILQLVVNIQHMYSIQMNRRYDKAQYVSGRRSVRQGHNLQTMRYVGTACRFNQQTVDI